MGETAGAGRVFISYVHEDIELVDRLSEQLKACGIPIWRDIEQLALGRPVIAQLQEAIENQSAMVIACLSKEAEEKPRTVMRQELGIALELLRQMRPTRSWFLPVMLNECDPSAFGLPAGSQQLLYEALWRDWPGGLTRLVSQIRAELSLDPPFPRHPHGTEKTRTGLTVCSFEIHEMYEHMAPWRKGLADVLVVLNDEPGRTDEATGSGETAVLIPSGRAPFSVRHPDFLRGEEAALQAKRTATRSFAKRHNARSLRGYLFTNTPRRGGSYKQVYCTEYDEYLTFSV